MTKTNSNNRRLFPSMSATRTALIVLVPLAVLIGAQVVAWAATLKTWTAGETLTATDLNANFDALNTELASHTHPSGREVVTAETTSATTFQQSLTLTCPAGKVPTGGGYLLLAANNSTNVDAMVTVNQPTATGWQLHAHGDNGAAPGYAWLLRGWVICVND